MGSEGPGTARHWIVAIIAAASVLAGLLIFGCHPDEPSALAPAPASQPPQ
jgi:hypothetical protein